MFGGLTKTSSRIAIAAALGMTLGGLDMSAHPAKAADLGGDCCADLEERVAELEATTVRKGNKKVSVTLSGWVVKTLNWWDDGFENNFYVGDKHTTLSSHFTISGQATIAPGWSSGYNLTVEVRGGNAFGDDNQFDDNSANGVSLDILGNTSALLSYMWMKSDKYGTVNWGQLSQATDNVALLPDLSGTIIESNAVLFDGQAFFLRTKGSRGSNGLFGSSLQGQTWGSAVTCISAGGGIGADCNGYPENGIRYDSPTFGGFSVSGGFYEDDVKDVAIKYAADWNSIKVSAAFGYSNVTDEGCNGTASSSPNLNCNQTLVLQGGGGAPFQGFRRDVDVVQAGASIMHVPSGLWVYGMWQEEDNHGTRLGQPQTSLAPFPVPSLKSSAQNDNDVWFVKAGIRRTWTPLGATVLWGEYGQYNDQYSGLCDTDNDSVTGIPNIFGCSAVIQTAFLNPNASHGPAPGSFVIGNITGSQVTRYGIGAVQEIDSAAMHVFARWQHLDLDLSGQFADGITLLNTGAFDHVRTPKFDGLDIFQLGGVIFF